MTNPSVTEATSFSIDGGPSKSVGSSSIRYLIADPSTEDGTHEFVVLAVDIDKGTVRGLVQRGHKIVSLSQDDGGSATVTDASSARSREWKCFNDEVEGRRLSDHDHHHDEHHDHDHKLHDLKDIAAQLGIDVNHQNRRRAYLTDDWPFKWSYQVDLYIEVDTAMITARDPTDTTNIPNTIEYVNALISAVSAIYEKEVDTHCESISLTTSPVLCLIFAIILRFSYTSLYH